MYAQGIYEWQLFLLLTPSLLAEEGVIQIGAHFSCVTSPMCNDAGCGCIVMPILAITDVSTHPVPYQPNISGMHPLVVCDNCNEYSELWLPPVTHNYSLNE